VTPIYFFPGTFRNTRLEKRRRTVQTNWRLPFNVSQEILRFLSLRQRFTNIAPLNSMFNGIVQATTENTEDMEITTSKRPPLRIIRMFNTVKVSSGIENAVPCAINCATNVVLRDGWGLDTIDFGSIIGSMPLKSLCLLNVPVINIHHLDLPNIEHFILTVSVFFIPLFFFHLIFFHFLGHKKAVFCCRFLEYEKAENPLSLPRAHGMVKKRYFPFFKTVSPSGK
jgi:hypothetical protein